MLCTQILKKWDIEQLKVCEKDQLEKQVKEIDSSAEKALTEWTNYQRKIK